MFPLGNKKIMTGRFYACKQKTVQDTSWYICEQKTNPKITKLERNAFQSKGNYINLHYVIMI